jgi:thiosulfate/3-mercaptopyruvate sulfurtransferase
MRRIFSVLLAIFTTFQLSAALITVKEFSELLKTDKDLVVVDCDRASNYATSHIKGAINIFPQELFNGKPDGIFKSTDEMAKFFGSKGISESSRVVLYDDGSNKYTSTIYFLLTYIGAKDVKIMTKVMAEFEKYRLPLTAAVTKKNAVTFTPNVKTGRLITIADFKTKLAAGPVLVVDTRKIEEFKGEDADKKSKGHLPGAISINYKEFLNADGSYKAKPEIESLVAKYELTADKDVVIYCNSGVLAAVAYYALHDMLGYQNVMVLEGGYNHWVLDASNTLEK